MIYFDWISKSDNSSGFVLGFFRPTQVCHLGDPTRPNPTRIKLGLARLTRTQLPGLVSWVRSFLTGRSCRLLFQGSPRISSPVSVGTPQGSPVSPLLFVINVAPLDIPLDPGLVLFYVDHLSLTVSSPSHRSNSRFLQAAFRYI